MTDLICRIEGRAGRVTLNRPGALNALTYDMILALEAQLIAWRDDPAVELVVIDGSGERAFCAGGDIQDLYQTGRDGDFAFGQAFWADEYRLNALIAGYPKPYVAMMHGFVMGGGVGVSALGSHRVVTDGTQVAMPECGIGLIPDVGGTLLLARAPGRLGAYLGTTGARMGPGEAILAGFADAYVPEARMQELGVALSIEGIGALEEFTAPQPEEAVAAHLEEIDTAFAGTDAMAVLARLDAHAEAWAVSAAKALRRNCPLSVACALEAIGRAAAFARFEEALALEYRFSARCMEEGEFLEGVRAAVIDKDRAPVWATSYEALTEGQVVGMLAPLGEMELRL
ncbi:MAG: enoyl-CoA hydratase/isomerase family protein [Pseudomonadota bacterium]